MCDVYTEREREKEKSKSKKMVDLLLQARVEKDSP